MAHVDTALLRRDHPEKWNALWRSIKAGNPALANHLSDPFIRECIEKFGATVEIPLNEIPPEAITKIPLSVIIED